MEKTVLLGNRASIELANKINAELIEVPDLYDSELGAINDFVISNLRQEFRILVIDADNFQRCEVALAIGMYMRFSFTELGVNALNPIVVVSDKSLKTFLNIKTYSQLFLTPNFYFQSRQEVILDAVIPLKVERYQEDFLDYVHVLAGAETGRHSLANQWGANVLYNLLDVEKSCSNPHLNSASKSLYFKYVYAKSINVADFLAGGKQSQFEVERLQPIDAKDKRILLIDDEADKGWSDILGKLIITTNRIKIFNRKINSYKELDKEIRQGIEQDIFDLVFLDLRINGLDEESIYNPNHFSGMKILKRIKQENVGIQVIMLTASNKAWNLKALLDEGADGYYMKESPEYGFSEKFSEANTIVLCDTIKKCLERQYLKNIYASIKQIGKDIEKKTKDKADLDYRTFLKEILTQIKLAFEMENLCDPTDNTDEGKRKFAYAYITLYQVIEQINKKMVVKDNNGVWRLGGINGTTAAGWSDDLKSYYSIKEKGNDWSYPEWMKMASLIKNYWNLNDNNLIKDIRGFIKRRNAFIHDDKDELKSKYADIFTPEAFKNLFVCINKLMNHM